MTNHQSPTKVFSFADPPPQGRLAIEASAGTGKTFTLAGLVTLLIAERGVPISEILVVTFTRAATNELRSRVRRRMVDTMQELQLGESDDPITARLLHNPNPHHLPNLRQAISDFDSATITTIHGFATQVLGTLGVMSGTDPDARLVDNTSDLVSQVCADLLAGQAADGVDPTWLPPLNALTLAVEKILEIPGIAVVPDPSDESLHPQARTITSLALEAAGMVHSRREASSTMSFDDVLVRLRDSITGPGADSVVAALRGRFSVALIDEFQDTDQVQWQIFRTLFGTPESKTTLVLVGDPKQAIYSFRGADINTYLEAVHSSGDSAVQHLALSTNWRSDGAMLSALEALLNGTTFGNPTIAFQPVEASSDHEDLRMRNSDGGPIPALSIRLAIGPDIERTKTGIKTDAAREAIFSDLACHIGGLLTDAMIPDQSDLSASRRVTPSDIAVLVRRRADGERIQQRLRDHGIPALLARGASVLESEAARQWRLLLHAMARPSDPARARSYAISWFGGRDIEWIRDAPDEQIAELQDSLRDWFDILSESGLAVAFGRIKEATGVTARVLGHPSGDREITDLDHVAELLHNAFNAGALSPAALLASLDVEPESDADSEVDGDITSRRVESEADAVQILTVWVSKGLEFPIVCVPTLWTNPPGMKAVEYHDPATDQRTFDIVSALPGSSQHPPKAWPDRKTAQLRRDLAAAESTAESLRLMYVALTRARHHTAVWWSKPTKNSKVGLSRALFGPEIALTDPVTLPSDDDLVARLQPLIDRGAGNIEVVVHGVDPAQAVDPTRWQETADGGSPPALALAELRRVPDRHTNRWSFSAIVNQVDYHPDPHDTSMSDRGASDEREDGLVARGSGVSSAGIVSPLATLPAGASFGTLVHHVLEDIDFTSHRLGDDLRESVINHTRFRSVDLRPVIPDGATTSDGIHLLVDGLATAIRSPLGPLFDGARLQDVARADRLDEMSFELLLGDRDRHPSDREIGAIIVDHLPPDDPLRPWAAGLADGAFGVELGGHLTGSIDALIRVVSADGASRFVVVDYKSNRLHDPSGPPKLGDYSQSTMASAMAHHHYGLQALLYSVAVHRYLRWRLPEYDPTINLGGAAYLFVRGMAGPEVAHHDSIPEGVFTWRIPPALVVDLSDLLAGSPRFEQGNMPS